MSKQGYAPDCHVVFSICCKLFAKKKKTGKTNMGSVLGGAMKETMDDNMKKNQEFMLETQKIQVRQC